MLKFVSGFVVLFLFWLLLSYTLEAGHLIAGVLATLLVLGVMAGRAPSREWLLNPVRLFWLLLYIPYFVYYCIRANFDVAYRVLHPDVPIRPGIVKVTTRLRTGLARTFLANSITLTPGTLTVDIDGQDLYVHWINVTTDDPQERTAQIVERFEGFLARIFE